MASSQCQKAGILDDDNIGAKEVQPIFFWYPVSVSFGLFRARNVAHYVVTLRATTVRSDLFVGSCSFYYSGYCV